MMSIIQTALSAILKSTGYVTRRHGNMIYVGTEKDFQDLEQALDKIGTRIYRTNYVRSTDLQALITPLLTHGVGTISVTPPSEIGHCRRQHQSRRRHVCRRRFGARPRLRVGAGPGRSSGRRGRSSRPMQVAIEAMILSVKLDDQNSFGVSFSALRDKAHVQLTSGNPLAAASAASTPPTAGLISRFSIRA